ERPAAAEVEPDAGSYQNHEDHARLRQLDEVQHPPLHPGHVHIENVRSVDHANTPRGGAINGSAVGAMSGCGGASRVSRTTRKLSTTDAASTAAPLMRCVACSARPRAGAKATPKAVKRHRYAPRPRAS